MTSRRQDHPHCRAQSHCVICGAKAKPHHGLMCWPCWAGGGKAGEHDSQLDAAEDYYSSVYPDDLDIHWSDLIEAQLEREYGVDVERELAGAK